MAKPEKNILLGHNPLFPEETAPHIFLMFFALAIQLVASALSGVGFSLNGSFFWLAGFALWILWFLIMLIIVNPHTDTVLKNHREGVKRGALIIIISLILLGAVELATAIYVAPSVQRNNTTGDFAQLLIQMEHGFQYNDGTALQQQAAENLLRGKNPYAHANIIAALLKYHGSFDRVTPLRSGTLDVFPYPSESQLKEIWDSAIQNPSQSPPEIESRVCYPAGFFLLPAPFIAAGIKDIRIVYLIFIIAGLAYVIWKIPPSKRLLFIVFAAISLELWNSLADGETGSIVFPLLLIAWVSLDKNQLLSTVAMGLAVATKQTAWFFLPFYLILLWRKSGIRPLAFAVGIIAGIFILMNAYFILKTPTLWLSSLASPMTDPMFPIGVGVVSMVAGGVLNIRSALPFTILEAIIFIGCVVWYVSNAKQYPFAGPILAVLPLFFAWRSLWSLLLLRSNHYTCLHADRKGRHFGIETGSVRKVLNSNSQNSVHKVNHRDRHYVWIVSANPLHRKDVNAQNVKTRYQY